MDVTQHDPAGSQLCLPLSGDRGSAALRSIAASRKKRGRRSSSVAGAPCCRHCGAPVQVPRWLLAQELENYYCNAECRREWAREDVKGGNRRTPVSTKAASRCQRGANWGVQSRAARERDRYACRVCGVTEEELGKRLHVHHTIPYSRFKSNIEANRLDYLVSVCPSCHGQLEAQLRKDLPLFAEIEPSIHEHTADGRDPADHGDDRRQILGGN